MNALYHLGQHRAADLRAEAARDHLTRLARQVRNQRPSQAARGLNLRALLLRLRLA